MPPTRAGNTSPGAPLAGLPLALSWGDFKIAHRFRAMNTAIELFAMDPRSAVHLTAAEQVFHDVEQRFSRFRDDSELSRLNARRDTRVVIPREMLELLSLAQKLHTVTEGVFEPAVLPRLEAAGYDRSFERVERDGTATALTEPQERHSIGDVPLAVANLTFEAPPGLRLDLGGISKGYTVDKVAAQLAPIRDFLVNAGGTCSRQARAPAATAGWRASPIRSISRKTSACCTCATRRWRPRQRPCGRGSAAARSSIT